MYEYIDIGRLNSKLLKELDIDIITEDVIFTFERMNHVKSKRLLLYEEIKDILPKAIYKPDYIYKDWNNRKNTFIFIKNIDKNLKLDIVIKIAVVNDKKHSKNSIITIIKIGEKTFKKICRNKTNYLLLKRLDKKE